MVNDFHLDCSILFLCFILLFELGERWMHVKKRRCTLHSFTFQLFPKLYFSDLCKLAWCNRHYKNVLKSRNLEDKFFGRSIYWMNAARKKLSWSFRREAPQETTDRYYACKWSWTSWQSVRELAWKPRTFFPKSKKQRNLRHEWLTVHRSTNWERRKDKKKKSNHAMDRLKKCISPDSTSMD